MIKLEIPTLEDALVGAIAEPADWIVANLETAISWPVSYQMQEYAGRTFFIIPLTKDRCPAVALKRFDDSLQQCRSALLRFLSAMSWSQSAGAIVLSFGNDRLPRPQRRGGDFGLSITADLNLTYLPEPADERQALGLALMREGRGLNHPAYAFLSFFRVLEVAFPEGKDQKKWVADNIAQIADHSGQRALAKLAEAGIEDVGTHLYKSGRMAIAHARADPVINPDDASDYDRIAGELPILRCLAELAIERILGIKTRSTIYSEHLYELAGFKQRIGADLVSAIIADTLPEGGEIDIPSIDIEIRRREPYAPLKVMVPVGASIEAGTLDLDFRSPDGLVTIHIGLDFIEERLRFAWDTGISGTDDGTSAAAENGAEVVRFILEYIGNGELHFYDSESRDLLGRVEAFLPVNYMANHEGLEARIAHWKSESARRREGES